MENKSSYEYLSEEVENLRQNEARLEALLQMNQMKDVSEGEVMAFALESAVALTKSRAGYLHLYNEYNRSLDLTTWSEEVKKVCTAEPSLHYPLESAGLWADSIRERKAVIHNYYQSESEKKGYPEGHFDVVRHLSVPVFDLDKIVAVAGVGNKDIFYDDRDVRQTMLFMNSMWTILKQKKAEEVLKKYSFEDGLTGLANRRRFDEVLNIEWRRAYRSKTPLAVIMIDIDFFKDYNDLYGHQGGDEYLQKVAECLKKNVRRSGELAARYGGEEFVIILPDTGIEKATALAEVLREAVHGMRRPHDCEKSDGYVTISAGVSATVPEEGTGCERLVKEADEELYNAKRSGRNCVKGSRLDP